MPLASAEFSGGLKDMLSETWRMPPLPRFESVDLKKACQKVEQKWGAIDAKAPATFDLEILWKTVSEIWQRTGSLEEIRKKDRKWIPWIVFFPEKRGAAWLGADPSFTGKLLKLIAHSRRPSATASLIHNFLLHYPLHLETFDRWRKGIRELVAESKSPRLAQWKERFTRFALFEAAAPKSYGQLLAKTDEPPSHILESSGLNGHLGQSAFLKAAAKVTLEEIKKAFNSGRVSIALVERVRSIFEMSESGLRFVDAEMRGLLADTLLLPYEGSPYPEEIKKAIQKFLLQHYGDPRIPPASHWTSVAAQARNIMYSWLVEVTMEDFLRLIDKSAFRRHWDFRRRFWKTYLDQGFIKDAWIALGPKVVPLARQLSQNRTTVYATLQGAVESSHSVLLMRIGSLIIAEWSHNGTCRIWHQNNKKAPRLYEAAYHRFKLTDAPDFKKAHRGAERDLWQQDVRWYIRRETGIEPNMKTGNR